MTVFIRCSGCGVEFGPPNMEQQPAITGERSNGFGGAGMPDGAFHWCVRCGQAAFKAVADRVRGMVIVGMVPPRPTCLSHPAA